MAMLERIGSPQPSYVPPTMYPPSPVGSYMPPSPTSSYLPPTTSFAALPTASLLPGGYCSPGPPGPAYGYGPQGPPGPPYVGNIPRPMPIATSPSGEPQFLPADMPDPEAVSRQKDAYMKMLDQQLQQNLTVLDQRIKYQRDALTLKGEQQKKHLIMQLEQNIKAQDMALTQQYNQEVTSLQLNVGNQRAALEQQAMQVVLDYEQRKAEELLYRQQYEVHRKHALAAAEFAEEQRRAAAAKTAGLAVEANVNGANTEAPYTPASPAMAGRSISPYPYGMAPPAAQSFARPISPAPAMSVSPVPVRSPSTVPYVPGSPLPSTSVLPYMPPATPLAPLVSSASLRSPSPAPIASSQPSWAYNASSPAVCSSPAVYYRSTSPLRPI
eukprot:TRINITY_DN50960_c0_g1_i1.p1 TRINITY_DN50960_c0_g1~~TRINITY_DN50960_c0_g1_i1.p1  ORF type:complete len:383 (+),score=75.28 TRINITY_DN50960_c0_g1_i1:80-1228(+)